MKLLQYSEHLISSVDTDWCGTWAISNHNAEHAPPHAELFVS